jgi:hypothetical protein
VRVNSDITAAHPDRFQAIRELSIPAAANQRVGRWLRTVLLLADGVRVASTRSLGTPQPNLYMKLRAYP